MISMLSDGLLELLLSKIAPGRGESVILFLSLPYVDSNSWAQMILIILWTVNSNNFTSSFPVGMPLLLFITWLPWLDFRKQCEIGMVRQLLFLAILEGKCSIFHHLLCFSSFPKMLTMFLRKKKYLHCWIFFHLLKK